MSMQRHFCCACGKQSKDNKLCSTCHVAAYCSKECQDKDWPEHKQYCKHLVYMRSKDIEAAGGIQRMKYVAEPGSSQIFQDALAAAKARGQTMSENDARQEECYVLMTAMAGEKFAKVLHDDMIPSCETEEHMWGLYGEPRSPAYQRLLYTYQKAFQYGDLTATKLMEALCARPNASKALTDLLHNTKIIATETDTYYSTKTVIDMYLQLIEGLEIVSEFDKWPIRSGNQPTAV